SLNQANLNGVNFTSAMIYDADVTGASMERINLTNAQIYGTGIAVGGGNP
ncbi:MAG: pentapeptide repeat-containing protein, partial [Microcystis aeruginosa]